MTKAIESLVVVSDLHCGCELGLCPQKGARRDEGGRYIPSSFQSNMWALWQEFWRVHVPRMTAKKPYAVVINGDILDGVHHKATTQWTHNLASQAECALEILRPVQKLCQGRLYIVRGTEAHSGKAGELEEWLARELGVIPNRMGQHARYELWKKLGRAGGSRLVHILHHIGTTSASAYESTALYRELVEAYVDAGRWNDRPPDAVVRGHRHRHFCIQVASGRGQALAVVTPGWQGRTPFAYRIAGARQSQPQFGGVVLHCRGDHGITEEHQVWRLEREPPE